METKTEDLFPTLTTIGIDIGKDIFHIVGFDTDGKIALRKIKRLALADRSGSCRHASSAWKPA